MTSINLLYVKFFDKNYYICKYSSDAIRKDCLDYYLNIGWKKNEKPNTWFDPFLYMELNPDVDFDRIEPFTHYLTIGEKEGRNYFIPKTYNEKTQKLIDILYCPDGFDRKYYLSCNYDVAFADVDPLEHYLSTGYKEGRKPNACFDPLFYMDNYPDVKASGLEPLLHYLLIGKKENRIAFDQKAKELLEKEADYEKFPSSLLLYFDEDAYLLANKDVALAVKNGVVQSGLCHFLIHGYHEVIIGKRQLFQSLPAISMKNYLQSNQSIRQAIENQKVKTAFEYFIRFHETEQTNFNPLLIFGNTEINKLPVSLFDPQAIELQNLILKAPKYGKPKVSILIPAYNQARYTLSCIKAIITNTDSIAYEIIVLDDNSTDIEAKNLYKYLQNINFISNKENLGFLENCNQGAKYANGDYIVFLNNDTNVQSGWLTSLVELIQSNSKIGMVGSRLVYPDGTQQEAGGIIWQDGSGWNFGKGDDFLKPEYNYVREVDYISGAAIMLSKKLWNEIGGFDKRYKPAYYEDTDLAFEVRKQGYKVMYQPKSIVVHFEGVSNGIDISTGIKHYQKINKEKFFDKWKVILEKHHYPNGQDVYLAKEQNDKKTLLFVDHYIPHYDQDAGSKAAYQYLNFFVNSGMLVKFIGDNFYWYPEQPYLEALQQIGIEVLYGQWYNDHWKEWFIEYGREFDYVVLSRPHIAGKYIDIIREYSKAKIIYFGHDLHFLREQREFLIKHDPDILDSSIYWKKIEIELMQKANTSYFFSQYEADQIKTIDSSINVKVTPLYLFEHFKKVNYNASQRQGIMFLGGFNHSPNVDAVNWFVSDIWPVVKQKIPDIKFYIIGSNPPESIQKLHQDGIIVTGFISDEKLEEYFKTCRIMVAPLRYGAGIKGKIVQGMYEGIPIITTSIGAEGLVHSEDYLVVTNDEKDMIENIVNLYTNYSKLEYFSKNVNQYCKKHFSFKQMKKYFNI